MKYFLDTEFIEAPNTIDLISIGIKCKDGRTFYAESTCFDERKANQWVKENVISNLLWYGNPNSEYASTLNTDTSQEKTEVFGTLDVIRDKVIDFVGDDTPEFWGYYADYDWVVFCWLFGKMIDLPKKFPMYCRDLKQLADDIGKPKFTAPKGEHNALVDAIWNESFYNYLTGETMNSRDEEKESVDKTNYEVKAGVKQLHKLLTGMRFEVLRKNEKCKYNCEGVVKTCYNVFPRTLLSLLNREYPERSLEWYVEKAYFIYKELQETYLKVLCDDCQMKDSIPGIIDIDQIKKIVENITEH